MSHETKQDDSASPNSDALGSDLAECQKLNAGLEEKYKRALADYQNREKDIARERSEFAQFCAADVIRDFLSIMDTVEAATQSRDVGAALRGRLPDHPIGHAGGVRDPSLRLGTGSAPPLRSDSEGLSSLYRLCLDFLKRHGVEPVGAVGDHVDYLLYEVVGTRTEEGREPETVLEVAQIGYLMNGRLLRPAKVIIAE
ncbi:MAG: nucleotide exchange factor GrpE [Candidatus Uhrbacteria bacterium]